MEGTQHERPSNPLAPGAEAGVQPEAPAYKRLQRLYDFLVMHHLLILLVLSIVLGLAFPAPGEWLSSHKVGSERVVSSVNVFVVFFVSGLRLRLEDVVPALKTPLPLLLGLGSILVVTPCVGWLPLNLSFIEPEEFRVGFTVFLCCPTALTSGAAFVAECAPRASVLALMLTISTNLLSSFTTPLALRLILSSDSDIDLDATALLLKLLATILLPVVLGKLLTFTSRVATDFCNTYKVPIRVFANVNLVCIAWQSVSRNRDSITEQSEGRIFICCGLGVALHLLLWFINSAVYLLPPVKDPHNRRAVLLLGSQKTLMVALAVISGFPEDEVNQGLLTLPVIISHLAQFILDTFLVSAWLHYDRKHPSDESASPTLYGT